MKHNYTLYVRNNDKIVMTHALGDISHEEAMCQAEAIMADFKESWTEWKIMY